MRIALVQQNSTRNVEENLKMVRAHVETASKAGAEWVLFPENTSFLGKDREKLPYAETLDGPQVSEFCQLARAHKVWLTIGSFAEQSPDPLRTFNTQVHISPQGEIVATYRKIHLFDVDVDDAVRFQESASVYPGDEFVVTEVTSRAGRTIQVGLSICYDLRFPGLYQRLRASGAEVITVPSAFTLETGRAHWHPLLQARAIETQTYVLAPNQWGHHYDRRSSLGQSAVYNPWGHRIACAPDGVGYILAELDFEYLDKVRSAMPVFDHRRLGLSLE